MMAFDWRGYKTLALSLSRTTDEASMRTAISRAYYFVYHLALARAETNHYKPKTRDSVHKQLWDHYEKSLNPKCIELAVTGRRMKRLRSNADYDDDFPRVNDAVTSILSDCQQCESKLTALPAGVP